MERISYRTIAGPVQARVEERRSVFECWLRRVGDEQEARAVVEQARATHWQAGHHCSAFVLGPDGALTRSSDDGEPSGTAGQPMLEVLTGAGLSDVVAVVTRWFGGTLLGTGGLVRAYSEAVRRGLAQAVVQQRELRQVATIEVGHGEAGRVEHELRARGVTVLEVRYAAQVALDLAVPAADVDRLADGVAEATQGRARLALGPRQWVDVP